MSRYVHIEKKVHSGTEGSRVLRLDPKVQDALFILMYSRPLRCRAELVLLSNNQDVSYLEICLCATSAGGKLVFLFFQVSKDVSKNSDGCIMNVEV